MSHEVEKEAAARASMRYVHEGQVVGLGSGSTSTYMVQFLGDRVKAGLKIRGVPSSEKIHQLAQSLKIPLTTLTECPELDVAIDGADQIDSQLSLIKGGGGALLREKIVASAAKQFVIIADSSKVVPTLGSFPVPVEVIAFAQPVVKRKIEALGASVQLRQAGGSAFVTDEGHHILDCSFGQIPDPAALAGKLSGITGVVEHGLFIGMAGVVLVAKGQDVTELRRR